MRAHPLDYVRPRRGVFVFNTCRLVGLENRAELGFSLLLARRELKSVVKARFRLRCKLFAVLLVVVKRSLRRRVHSGGRRKSVRKLARDDPAHARVHLFFYRPPSGNRVYHLLRAVEVKAARRRLKVRHAVRGEAALRHRGKHRLAEHINNGLGIEPQLRLLLHHCESLVPGFC